MSWAAGRRFLIASIVLGVIALIVGAVLFSLLYKAPSCSDKTMNGQETGIDCGGVCTYLCTADVPSPVVTFARDLRLPNGRTDVIAYLENPNPTYAAKKVGIMVELYATDRSLISEKQGVIDLPPKSAGPVPVYIPNFFSGTEEVATVFVDVDEATLLWYRVPADPRLLPEIENPTLENEQTAPRVRATVRNQNAVALRNVTLVATVFDAEHNAIAASRTVVAELPAGGRTEAVFTWTTPFSSDAAVIEVRPAVPLP